MSNYHKQLRKNRKKFFGKVFFLFLLPLFFLWLIIVQRHSLAAFISRPAKLEVNFLDVGQGDAALIKTPAGRTILIDGGPDNKVLWRLGENLPFYRRRLDLVIFSHYHEDHVTGLIEILKRYRVKKIIYADNKSGVTATAAILIKEAQTKKIPIASINSQATLSLGDNCALVFLSPTALGVKIDPNNSLVVKLNCAGEKFLFVGDNSAVVEKALLTSGFALKADVLKAAHHGSNSASSAAFLQAVNPSLLAISVGADNKFGHPSPQTLERAAALDIDIKRTDQLGSVKIFSP